MPEEGIVECHLEHVVVVDDVSPGLADGLDLDDVIERAGGDVGAALQAGSSTTTGLR